MNQGTAAVTTIQCPCCGETYCMTHQCHYWDCACYDPEADDSAWQQVVELGDCESSEEVLICPACGDDYAECPCPGPHQDDVYEYSERNGVLCAKRRQ